MNGCGLKNLPGLLLGAAMVFAFARGASSQEASTQPISSQTETEKNRELLATVQALAEQLKVLNAKLDAVTTEQAKSAEEAKQLRKELDAANARLAALEAPSKSPSSTVETPGTVNAPANPETIPTQTASNTTQKPTLEERLSRIEENQDFLDAKIGDQYQSKLESGSKYRVRFSGIFLFNLYGNKGTVDNQDFPQFATEPGGFNTANAFGGSLRQSQIGIEGFGPDILGAHTSARLRFDFAGNVTNTENGALFGGVRLRTGTFRMDWKNTSLVAGQDALFFAPLVPTSIASIATPPLSYAGNLWGWTPQVRVEHRLAVSEKSSIKLSAGLMAPLSGDVPQEISPARSSAWGEQSGMPAPAAHIAWEQKTENGVWSLGAGGYYARQVWGYDRTVGTWVSTIDLLVPVTKYFQFSGEFYRGRGAGGLGGAIGQTIVSNKSLGDPTGSIFGLNSEGGWAQLKWKPRSNFEVNGAFGQDNPFATQLRLFPFVPSEYEEPLTRTRNWFVNFIYEPRSNVVMSFEYKRLRTWDIGPDPYASNNLNLSLGYIF
jgi:regulator of replication initiation timing